MKQIFQILKKGITEINDVPIPNIKSGNILINTSETLISAGTEKIIVESGKTSLVHKALKQPDKVIKIIDQMKTDGVKQTLESFFLKLDELQPLGYCNMGIIHECGSEIADFEIGDRVISNGFHAEFVSAPKNLCAKVPDNVTDSEAAFTVIASIALQGVRLAKPTLGETFIVTGLGLVGLITVQLLKASGCRVLGIDLNQDRLELAKKFGAEVINLSEVDDPLIISNKFSGGRGADGVIITASTKSNEPIHQAAIMSRKRGRIILVGVSGMELSRDDFYEKELTFQISCSYGPGRYDPNYEDRGVDYPIGFVRWTEQRNFEAILDMMSSGNLDVKSLISHRFKIDDALGAYDLVSGNKPSLGILLSYPKKNLLNISKTIRLDESIVNTDPSAKTNEVCINFIGSGNFAIGTLIPAFKKTDSMLNSIASNSGISSFYGGRKYGFKEVTTDLDNLFSDINSNTIVISTRHETHSDFILKSINANKHIFVEKPLCLNLDELKNIYTAYSNSVIHNTRPNILMVGYNRRFAPHIKKIKELLKNENNPKSFTLIVNSGFIPSDHWTQKINIGGGRIIGEVCHFIDLLRFLCGYSIEGWNVVKMDSESNDTLSIQLTFSDGSIGVIQYYSNGHSSVSKEHLEIYSQGKILKLDNFKKLTGYGWPGFKNMNLWNQDKGHNNCTSLFVNSIKQNLPSPIPFEEVIEVSRLSIEIANVVSSISDK